MKESELQGKKRQGRGCPSVIPKEDFGQLLFLSLEAHVCFTSMSASYGVGSCHAESGVAIVLMSIQK